MGGLFWFNISTSFWKIFHSTRICYCIWQPALRQVSFLLGFASFLQHRSFVGNSYLGSDFFFLILLPNSHYHYYHQLFLSRLFKKCYCLKLKSKLTIFPKGKHQKKSFITSSFAILRISSHRISLVPEAVWKLTIQEEISGDLHFWWMKHLKILWHSSHDLF